MVNELQNDGVIESNGGGGWPRASRDSNNGRPCRHDWRTSNPQVFFFHNGVVCGCL